MRLTVRRSLPKRFVLNAPVYPPAVHPSFLCRTDADRQVWAFSVVNGFIDEPLAGVRFGDHAADPFIARAAEAAGAVAGPPYDVYLMYDVLDHVTDRHPSEVLNSVAAQLADGGRIYVRLHPWTSRHGTHLYNQLNKAFLSVYLTPKELADMGLHERPTRRGFIGPVDEYRAWVYGSGLATKRERVYRSPVEPVFEQLRQRGELDTQLYQHMDVDFVDFVLGN